MCALFVKVDMDEIIKGGSQQSPRSARSGASPGADACSGGGGAAPGGPSRAKGKGKGKGRSNLLLIEMLGETSAVVATDEGGRKQSTSDVTRSIHIALVSQEERTSQRLTALEKGVSAQAVRFDESLARLEQSMAMLHARLDGGAGTAAPSQGASGLPPVSQLPSATPEEDRAQRMAKRQSRQLRRGRSAGARGALGGAVTESEEGEEAVASSPSAPGYV